MRRSSLIRNMLLSASALGIAICATGAAAETLYVSGSAAGPGTGTLSNPFQTIKQCADIAVAGDTCAIRGGTYRETVRPLNSGTAGAPITFENYNGEQVVISGANLLTTSWSPFSGSIYQTTFSLPASSYNDTGLHANQLFIGGQALTEARWPNISSDLTTDSRRATAGPGSSSTRISDSSIPDILGGWAGGYAYVLNGAKYTSQSSRITANAPGQLSLDANMLNIDGCPNNCVAPGSDYFLFGRLGALDAENEWYYDSAAGRVYVWVPGGATPEGVEYKARVNAFDLRSRAHITVRGIKIFSATVTSDSASNNITVDGVAALYVSHYMTVPVDNGPNAELYKGIYSAHSTDTGLILLGTNNVLRNSEINWSSGNGVLIGPGGVVQNNLVINTNYAAIYNTAVASSGAVTIDSNNLFVTGRDTVTNFDTSTQIRNNKIYGFGFLTDDNGGIYTCCSRNLSGARISYNYVSGGRNRLSHGIYLDGGSGNAQIDHNVVWNTPGGNIALNNRIAENGPGSNLGNNQVYNNTLAGGFSLWSRNASDSLKNNIFRGLVESSFGAGSTNNLASGVDPLFADRTALNFTLSNGSPAIDAGVQITGVTDGFIGSGPDLGALELGSALRPPPGCTLVNCQISTLSGLLENGNFELASTNPWVTYGQAHLATTNRASGLFAIRLIGSISGAEQLVSNLKPSTTYILSGRAMRMGGSDLRIGAKNFGGQEVSALFSGEGYQQSMVEFTMGSSSTSATVYIFKENAAGQAVADEITLMEKTSPPTGGINYANNGGFESGSFSPWSGYGSFSIASSGTNTGSYAVRLSGSVVGIEQTITGLIPNTTYTLTAPTRMSTPGEGVYIGAKNFGGSEVSMLASNNSYAGNSISFTTGASNTSALVYLYKGSGSGDAFGDDVTLTTGAAPPPANSNVVDNPSFDVDSNFTQTPANWLTAGSNPEADYASHDDGGRTGYLRGTHWADHNYKVYTYQAKSGLPNGTYRARAYVRSTGGQNAALFMAKTGSGAQEYFANIPTTSTWTLVELNSLNVTDGTLEIAFYSDAFANQAITFDDVEVIKQ